MANNSKLDTGLVTNISESWVSIKNVSFLCPVCKAPCKTRLVKTPNLNSTTGYMVDFEHGCNVCKSKGKGVAVN